MGADKAWVEIEHQPMIERVIQAAAPIVDQLCICAGNQESAEARYLDLAARWNAPILQDAESNRGPLSGILAALRHFQKVSADVFVLACDLPFLSREFLSLILDVHRNDGAEISVPLDADSRTQPLAAIYNASCVSLVEDHLAKGKLRVDLLFERVSTRRIAYHEYAHLTGAEWFLRNMNSPGDLENARNWLK